jgi:hypothetical protein
MFDWLRRRLRGPERRSYRTVYHQVEDRYYGEVLIKRDSDAPSRVARWESCGPERASRGEAEMDCARNWLAYVQSTGPSKPMDLDDIRLADLARQFLRSSGGGDV